MHALIRSKFIDDGGVSCYADPATSRWASVWKVNGVMRYAEYAWQQIDWNASPVGRFFGEHNYKSSTDSNCRNLTILVVSRSASATFLESANICSIDSVVRSVASWCIASFHNTQESLEFPLWRPLPKQQKALSSNGNNFYYKPSKYSTYESRKNLDSFSLSILLLRSQSLSEQNM